MSHLLSKVTVTSQNFDALYLGMSVLVWLTIENMCPIASYNLTAGLSSIISLLPMTTPLYCLHLHRKWRLPWTLYVFKEVVRLYSDTLSCLVKPNPNRIA